MSGVSPWMLTLPECVSFSWSVALSGLICFSMISEMHVDTIANVRVDYIDWKSHGRGTASMARTTGTAKNEGQCGREREHRENKQDVRKGFLWVNIFHLPSDSISQVYACCSKSLGILRGLVGPNSNRNLDKVALELILLGSYRRT